MTINEWSEWRAFPDPRRGDALTAPFGPGCYELRRGEEPVLFGMANNVAHRMTSLLPEPLGRGTRNNSAKRRYVEEHLSEIEYRTLPCASLEAAKEAERDLKRDRSRYRFPT